MKYLIIDPTDHRILHISNDLDYQDNGNYLIYGGSVAVPPSISEMAEVQSVPVDVVSEMWCYIDGQFVINPNPPQPIPDPDYESLNELLDIIEGKR